MNMSRTDAKQLRRIAERGRRIAHAEILQESEGCQAASTVTAKVQQAKRCRIISERHVFRRGNLQLVAEILNTNSKYNLCSVLVA